MTKNPNLTYKKSGVDYSKIDPLKILAQKAAFKTSGNISSYGLKEISESRGESAYVVDCGNFYLASITECLGTKALVADEMRKTTDKTYYAAIAQDTIAMAVNDIITVGAKPISIHAYWAVGNSEWFNDKRKIKDLVKGWKRACDLSGACWGGGETPALSGIIHSEKIDLAASCVGIVKPKKRLILGGKLQPGDCIVVFQSSGIHANGITMAREVAKKLSKNYATKISDNTLYGEALLKPTIIYSPLIQDLLKERIDIHYMSNITGHGFRKIMRHPKSFTYRITTLPPIPPVFTFMQQHGPVSNKEAYSSFNMGAGFAIFVAKKHVAKTMLIAKKHNINACNIGVIEKGKKQVIIEPLNIVFKGESLKLRI